MMNSPSSFREIWAVDFEFYGTDGGDVPTPLCMVAIELLSGREISLWKDELGRLKAAPFATDSGALVVAFYASAELGCFRALGWPDPAHVLDLYAEMRVIRNGGGGGRSLLASLEFFGIKARDSLDKHTMRDLIIAGGPWSEGQKSAILRYCRDDVLDLGPLLRAVLGRATGGTSWLPQALLRGRFMAAVADMEHRGIPIDMDLWSRLTRHWGALRRAVVEDVNREFPVFEGTAFRSDRFGELVTTIGLEWPKLASGKLRLDDDTFDDLVDVHPAVRTIRDARRMLAGMHDPKLQVGRDGRARCLLSPFASRTGRNQPSGSKFLFLLPKWLRSLMKPGPGRAVAYIDWSSQEIAVAGALSGDQRLMDAYASGDVYMAFLIAAGLAPEGAKKADFKSLRQVAKGIVLGVGYGMSAPGMATRAGISLVEANQHLRRHRELYPRFWRWSDATVRAALARGSIRSRLGWAYHLKAGELANGRSLQNWPMQAHGAEMMRLACVMALGAGIELIGPVHDALLIEAPIDRIDADVAEMSAIMVRASEIVMGVPGFACRVDAEVVRYPDRYIDEAGADFFGRVMRSLDAIETSEVAK